MRKIFSGIYHIKNLINEKVYIGSSVNIKTRLAKHKTYLINNCHSNKHLQSSFVKYGESVFVFEVLEEVATLWDLESLSKEEKKLLKLVLKSQLIYWEQIYLDNYESWKPEN